MLRNHLTRQFLSLFFLLVILAIKPTLLHAASPTSAAAIDAYLQKYNSPMAGSGAAYMRWGQYFNVDPRFIVAISSAESSLGENTHNTYNAWGWFLNGSFWTGFAPGIDTDTVSYSNAPDYVSGRGISMATGWEDGIFWDTRTISAGYLAKGHTSVDAIAPIYCTDGTANWIKNVKTSLSELGGDPNQLSFPGDSSSGGRPILVPGSQWLGGQGVDAYDNGSDVNNDWGKSYVGSTYVGIEYQCVELPQRLYTVRGWYNGSFVANAVDIYDAAGRLGMVAHSNGSGYVPVPGDMVVLSGDIYGHVAVVDTVDSNNVNVVEQNWPNSHDRHSFARSGTNGSFLASRGSYTVRGVVHSPKNPNTNGGGNPPTINFDETHKNQWFGPGDLNTQIIPFSLQDAGGGIGGLSNNWDSDPGGSSPQYPGSHGGYLTFGYLPDATRQGKHTAWVRAWNGDNSQSAASSSTWYGYDALPPTVTITSSQTTGVTYNTPQTITWHIDDPDSGIKSWGEAWDTDPGSGNNTADSGSVDLLPGTHTLHIHTIDNVGNEKDNPFGPYTFTPQVQVGQRADWSIDQRYVDCYNRVGASVVGSVLNNNFVHTALGNGSGDGTAQDFVDGNGAKDIIIAKDGAAKAFDVSGNTWVWYSAKNFASGPTGFPTDDLIQITPATTKFDTPGTSQPFEGGTVYDSKYGTHEVPQGVWFANGLSLSTLVSIINGTFGFPTTDLFTCNPSPKGTIGQQEDFEYGAVYSGSGSVGTHGVYGAIFNKYAENGQPWSGGTSSPLGFPTSDVTSTSSSFGTIGQVSQFEGGSIYNSDKYGAHPVYGDIYKQYTASGASGGKHGFPTSDPYGWQGATRQDFEGGYLTTINSTHTHILWTNTNGTAAVWSVSTDGSFTSTPGYGPIPGWSARAMADGGDGRPRVLWTRSDGMNAVWTINADSSITSTPGYGPISGWNVAALAVGPDNLTRLQWKRSDGMSAVWTVAADGSFTSTPGYGPYGGWTAGALAVGGDALTRLLWDSGNGQFAVWTLDGSSGISSTPAFGPIPGWSASILASGPDTNAHLMLNRSDGAMALWAVNGAGTLSSSPLYGPIPNWSAHGMAVGSDSLPRVLWSRSDGMSSVWTVAGDGSITSTPGYGPIPGWRAIAIAAP